MAKKLYVGNLSYTTTKEHLEALFGEFGSVQSATVIMDRDTGRSKGFGFVEMADNQAADNAIKGLNGKQHDSRAMTVNEARPQTSFGGTGGGGGGFGSSHGGGRRDRS